MFNANLAFYGNFSYFFKTIFKENISFKNFVFEVIFLIIYLAEHSSKPGNMSSNNRALTIIK